MSSIQRLATCRVMETVIVPVSLVSNAPGEHCTDILAVPTDSMATLGQFKDRLGVALLKNGKVLGNLTYRGLPLIGNAKIHNYAFSNLVPRFAANYNIIASSNKSGGQLFVKTLSGKILTVDYRCASFM